MTDAVKGADGLVYRTSSFVGREHELQALAELLANPQCQLLTLVGPGGIGKTRLALEVAQRIAHTYADGVYFISLQPLRSHQLIPATIAHTLGLTLSEQEDALHNLITQMQHQRLLLILDNFEHLMEGTAQITAMLTALAEIQIMVTSREPLNLHEEWQWLLKGLDYLHDDAGQDIYSYSAVRLFCERAQHVSPSFAWQSCTDDLIRICQLVDGIPLALEMAANWVKVLPCAVIADSIQNSLDFLVSREQDIAERHSSMRAVFDCSWQLLSALEQATFQRITIFHGGFSLHAAEKVAATDLHTLAALVDKSFIRQNGNGRYDVHELLRQYGWQKLAASADVSAIAAAHTAYYADLLAGCVEDLQGSRLLDALDRIQTDFDNIRAAWSSAVAQRALALVDAIMIGLYEFAYWRGRAAEVSALFAEAVAALAQDDVLQQSTTFGRLLIRWGDDDLVQINQALTIARHAGDEREVAFCTRIRGIYHFQRQDFRLALLDLQTSRELFQRLDDSTGLMGALLDSAYAMGTIGDHDAVRSYLSQLAGLAHASGHQGYLYYAHFLSGWTDGFEGHYRSGEESMQQAHAIATRMRFSIKAADCAGALAFFAFLRGDFEAARHWTSDDLRVVMRARAPGSKGFARIVQAHIICVEGDYHEALRLSQEALALVKPHPHRERSIARVFAMTYCGLGDFDLALLHAHRVLLEERAQAPQLWILPVFALILAHQGDLRKAAEILGLTFTHPLSAPGWMRQWLLLSDLQQELSLRMGDALYQQAWESGAHTALATIVDELLLSIKHRSRQPLVEPLTQRELEVLHLIAAGLSNHEIADAMTVVEGTVKTHVYNLCQKLGARNRTQAVARARALNLL